MWARPTASHKSLHSRFDNADPTQPRYEFCFFRTRSSGGRMNNQSNQLLDQKLLKYCDSLKSCIFYTRYYTKPNPVYYFLMLNELESAQRTTEFNSASWNWAALLQNFFHFYFFNNLKKKQEELNANNENLPSMDKITLATSLLSQRVWSLLFKKQKANINAHLLPQPSHPHPLQ